MSSILHNLDRKVLPISGNKHHPLHTSLIVAGLDKLVTALDTLIDACQSGSNGILIEYTESDRHWSIRIGQLVHQILHGILANENLILLINR